MSGVSQQVLFEILAPLRGATLFLIYPGGFRFASTAGYYLPALRAEARQQLFGLLLKLEFAYFYLLFIAVQGTIPSPRR